MTLSDNVWLKLCENLIKSSVIPEEKICDYHIIPVQYDDVDTILKIDTESDSYKLNLSISESEDGSESESDERAIITFEEENVRIKIKNVFVEGYEPLVLEEIEDTERGATYLKYILKKLSFNHSHHIEIQNIKATEHLQHTLVREDFKKVISILYEVIEKKGDQEVDGALFKKAVEELYYSSEEILIQEENVYVESYDLQSKWFLKFGETVKYKVINLGPKKYLPLVYDVLLCIFSFSGKKMRQYHFHDLLDYYYKALRENLHKIGLDISNILPREKYEELVKKFGPYVKLEVALFNCQQYLEPLNVLKDDSFVSNFWDIYESDKEYFNSMWKTILEIYDFVLYPNLSTEDCYKIIENKTGKKDYEFLNWQLNQLEKRAGYLGDYYKLKIEIKQDGETKSLNFFAKYLPTYNKSARDLASMTFQKEEFFYGTFLSEANRLGLREIMNFFPHCYFSRSNDVIILEDLFILNYKHLKQAESLSYENLILIVKQLAKLHACSLLYEEIMTEKSGVLFRIGDKYSKFLEEGFFVSGRTQLCPVLVCAVSGSLKYLLDVFPDIPKKLSMQGFKEKAKELYGNMLHGLESTKFRNVITHGDLWSNNFLFKTNSSDQPIECLMVDYQLTRYCPPSHDVLSLLYLNTDKTCRKKYMSKVLEEYYKELSQIFKKYHFDLSKIYTFEEFLESCDAVKAKAVALASLYMQMVLYPPEKMQELMEDRERLNYAVIVDRKEIIDEVYHNDFYKERIRETVEDLYEACESI